MAAEIASCEVLSTENNVYRWTVHASSSANATEPFWFPCFLILTYGTHRLAQNVLTLKTLSMYEFLCSREFSASLFTPGLFLAEKSLPYTHYIIPRTCKEMQSLAGSISRRHVGRFFAVWCQIHKENNLSKTSETCRLHCFSTALVGLTIYIYIAAHFVRLLLFLVERGSPEGDMNDTHLACDTRLF
jgi:hypothetical protein